MNILGIETSCDETATAIVNDRRAILAHEIASQTEEHQAYGGVVPEIAARAHLDKLDRLITTTLHNADMSWENLDGIAATCGPGLIGGVLVGAMMGKAIAAARDLPFIAVNHLEAHALTARLTDNIDFPYLLLLVSGGHTQTLLVRGVGQYHCYGTSLDDAAGEAFDKVAKLLGLGFPGGPLLENTASSGDNTRFALPRPLKGKPGYDFSFSGLKTAVRETWSALDRPGAQDKADLAASFQQAVADSLADRTKRALDAFQQSHPEGKTLVVAGGVAANKTIRAALEAMARKQGIDLVAPPVALCTDNGAMVAWAGLERLRLGLIDGLDFAPRPRWPLAS